MGAGGLLLVVLLFGLSSPGTADLWFRRNVLLDTEEWPYRTRLLVQGFEEGHRGVPRGDPLNIDIEVVGEIPDRAWIDIKYAHDRRRYNLTGTGPRAFRYHHPEVKLADMVKQR